MIIYSRPQADIARSTARFKVVVSGRRFGKTYLAIGEMMRRAAPVKRRVWYVAPTYRMAKQIAWVMLKEELLALHWATTRDFNETDLSVCLPMCQSVISLRGADKPDSLRGVGLHYIVFDEFADIRPAAWYEVLRPTLSDTGGHAAFFGTPKGFGNWARDLYERGMDDLDPEWQSWQYTTLDGGNVPQSEIDQALSDLDERTFRQEYLATFEVYSGSIYYNFDRAESVKKVDIEWAT